MLQKVECNKLRKNITQEKRRYAHKYINYLIVFVNRIRLIKNKLLNLFLFLHNKVHK